jgi:hypothetical protein
MYIYPSIFCTSQRNPNGDIYIHVCVCVCQPAFAVGLSSRGTGEGDVVGDCSPSRSNEQGEKKTRPRDLESAWIFGELDLKVDDDFRGVFFTDLSSPRVSRTSRGQSNRAKWESLRSGRAFIKVRIESVGSLIFQ